MLRKMLWMKSQHVYVSLGHWVSALLRELDVVIPVVGGGPEAVSLRDDVEKDEQTLFYTDVWCIRFGVFYHPVGELYEGDLVHVAEVVEAIGDAIEQTPCSISTGRAHDRHVEVS